MGKEVAKQRVVLVTGAGAGIGQATAKHLAASGKYVVVATGRRVKELAALKEAVQLEPQNLPVKKQLASALERNKSYKEARQIWQELADKAKANGDKILAREARTRTVTLWGFERILDAQVAPRTQLGMILE